MPQRIDRIRALATQSRFRIGAVRVHPERLIIERDDDEIALEPRIMEVLVALAEHAGEVISAEQLLIEVWRGSFYGDNPVHRAIAQLRRHLGDDPRNPVYIETIRKRGYRLVAPVAFPDDYGRRPLQSGGWSGRNPYVGLTAFDNRHADVFFGRTRLTAELLAALRRQRESQRRFLLLVGASGCGKTSLLQAAALPLLTQAGGFDGMQALSVAQCDLAAGAGQTPAVRLASALATWQIDGRPVFAPQPPDALADGFAAQPGSIAETLDDAWRRRTVRNEAPHAHLLLLVDHAEALVASDHVDATQRRQAWAILDAVCNHPRGGVLMIVRGDFYPALIEALPGIADRKGGDGHIDAQAPTIGEIAQIVRLPAHVAGLSFEEDAESGARLDDVLRDAAVGRPDTLPLLQHTLHALYEQREADGTLTFAAYRAVGGLEGAIAHQAEAVFASLPGDVQARLDEVLARLILLLPDSDTLGTRRVPWSALEHDASRDLVEAFIRGRLFVGSHDADRPTFGVVHDALLRQWPRARDWALDNRRLLQAHARLQRAAARWDEAGRRDDHLLHPGQPLGEALEVQKRLPQRLSAREEALLDASLRLRRRGLRKRRLAIASLATLAITASLFALWAVRAQREAERRREDALRLSDFMLVDVADKLRPLGNLGLMRDVSQQALDVLDHDDTATASVAALVNRARALRTLGEVLMEEARLEQAQRAFDGAAHAAEAAVARAPASSDAVTEAGNAAYWLGYHAFRLGDHRRADLHWHRYLDHTGALLRLAPDRPEWLVERSYALNNLGTLANAQGHGDEAITRFRESAALKAQASRMRPQDLDLRYDLIDTLSWISSAQQTQGQLDRAAAGYAAQLDMLRALIRQRPTALAWERRLATSLRRSAELALMRGRTDDARAMLDESVSRLTALLPKAPENRVWRRDLAHALLDRAELARIAGDAPGAIADLRRASALSSELQTEGGGDQAEWRRLDALIRVRLAALRAQPAREREAMADLDRLVREVPDDVFGRSALAKELIAHGQRLAAAGRSDAAADDYARARALLARIAPGSRDPALLAPWVQAHLLAGLPADAALARLQASGYRHPDVALPLAQSPLSANGPPP